MHYKSPLTWCREGTQNQSLSERWGRTLCPHCTYLQSQTKSSLNRCHFDLMSNHANEGVKWRENSLGRDYEVKCNTIYINNNHPSIHSSNRLSIVGLWGCCSLLIIITINRDAPIDRPGFFLFFIIINKKQVTWYITNIIHDVNNYTLEGLYTNTDFYKNIKAFTNFHRFNCLLFHRKSYSINNKLHFLPKKNK